MRFLSSAWLAALDEAVSQSGAVSSATTDTTLTLLQFVTGGPDGDIAYLVTIDRGSVHVTPAASDVAADVTLASDWDTAVAIATGVLAAHDAFTTGRLVVRGDIEALRSHAPALAGLDRTTAEVRTATTY